MTGAKVVAPPFDCTTVGTDRSFVLLCTTLCQREGKRDGGKGKCMSNAQWRLFGEERRQTSLVLVFKRGGGGGGRMRLILRRRRRVGLVFDSRKKAVVVD